MLRGRKRTGINFNPAVQERAGGKKREREREQRHWE